MKTSLSSIYLRHQLHLQVPVQVLLLEISVFADIAADHPLDLSVAQQNTLFDMDVR